MAKSKASTKAGTKTFVAGELNLLAPRRYCGGALILETEQSFRGATSRGAAVPTREQTIADDRLIELELEGGIVLYTSFGQLKADFPTDAQARAAQNLPADAYLFPNVLPLAGEARGLTDWAVKAWNLLTLKFDNQLAGELAARGLSWLVEHRIAARAGLHALSLDDDRALERLADMGGPSDKIEINTGRPLLLLIHGTGSSTAGSFEGLWSPQNRSLRGELAARYGRNVFGFEHLTLSQGPIRNALDLAKELPAGARLHLVTHSRGGLVGELLARGNRHEVSAFDETDLEIVGEADAALLKELGDVLAAKRLRIERFVRVACPARGTSLASGRLDRYLSVIINVLRLASVGGTLPVLAQIEDFTAFAAAVIEQRKDPKEFPGLEAMMPESRLIRLVNRPGVAVAGDLTVIAGDAEPQGVLKRLALLVTDLYYRGEHDFIVDTDNMSGGAQRAADTARIFRHKHGDVSHFRYFVNGETSRRVVAGLLQGEGFATAFLPLARAALPRAARALPRAPSGPAPVVFFLPGIMGSTLGVAEDKSIDTVWIDFVDLAAGGLCKKLPIPDKFRVVAEEPLPRSYGRLIEYLGASHRVVPFAFDWRISLKDEAKRLAERMLAELDRCERENQPLRVLAHSMGGLLMRALLALHPEVWRRICLNPNARVVMLGTPTRGSHSITRVLAGQEDLVNMLAAVDLCDSRHEIVETVARYPGLLELLPDARGIDDAAGTRSLLDAGYWNSLTTEEKQCFALPASADLDAAKEVRSLIDPMRFEPGRLIYVAGKADETPIDFSAGKDGIEFTATDQGDGRVAWKTGIPPDATAIYYLEAAHGDLPDTPESFDALLDLLASGTTTRLPQQPPAGARGEARPRKMKAPALAAYPDEASFESAARGGARRRREVAKLPRVRISVRHGDLRYANHPLVVGHYFGDTIVSAERVLDRFLDNRLSARLQLGLYPGLLNTAEVFVNPDPNKPSAIIIGLGGVGELSVGSLAKCFGAGLLRYAALRAEGAFAGGREGSCGVAALLIGTGGGGLSIDDSLTGLLRGMHRAADALAASNYAGRVTFDELELIEIYEDRAIAAVHAIERLTGQVEFAGRFDAPSRVELIAGGRRRARFEEPPEWWQRLQITGSEDGGLRFVSLTQRARAEARLQALQRPLIDSFLDQVRAGTANDSSVGITLFELLLPNELKQIAPEQSNLVLTIDDESARYPWELLRDRASRDEEPIVVQRGVLRQLQTTEYRPNPDNCRNMRALVVGDPLSKFAELPGAQKEAAAVATALEAGDGTIRFEVTSVIRDNARAILRELMADDYRIVHLAGHGVFEYPIEEDLADPHCEGGKRKGRHLSGMVIGDGVFLTPIEVRQMRQVPELVFINCCHLGRVEPGSETNQWFVPHRLAANLAVEFIRMGVRAVIAAGWEVDDEAGRCFAQKFYREMLRGRPYGEAVQQARSETWDHYRQVNTWGAYQCYGDPDYRLRETDAGETRREPLPYVAAAEARVDLHNLASEVGSADPESRGHYVKRVGSIERRLPEDLLGDSAIRARLAGLYYDVGDYANALRCYRAADAAELTPRDIGHYANAATRRAEQLADAPAAAAKSSRKGGASEDEPLALVDQAIGLLGRLLRFGPTVDRFSGMGSAQKRRALLCASGKARVEALQRSAFAYASAVRLEQARGGPPDPYAAINAWSAQILLAWHGGKPAKDQPKLEPLETGLPEIEASAQGFGRSQQFWQRAQAGDCALLRLISKPTPSATDIKAVEQAYRGAAELGARPREWNSVLSQISILARLAESAGAKQEKIAEALNTLRTRLGA